MDDIQLTFQGPLEEMPDSVYDDLYDLSVNGPEIYPKNEYIPTPWDAAIYVEKGYVVLDGSMIPGGSTMSSCLCKIVPNELDKFYKVSITPGDEESADRINEILDEYGWL